MGNLPLRIRHGGSPILQPHGGFPLGGSPIGDPPMGDAPIGDSPWGILPWGVPPGGIPPWRIPHLGFPMGDPRMEDPPWKSSFRSCKNTKNQKKMKTNCGPFQRVVLSEPKRGGLVREGHQKKTRPFEPTRPFEIFKGSFCRSPCSQQKNAFCSRGVIFRQHDPLTNSTL